MAEAQINNKAPNVNDNDSCENDSEKNEEKTQIKKGFGGKIRKPLARTAKGKHHGHGFGAKELARFSQYVKVEPGSVNLSFHSEKGKMFTVPVASIMAALEYFKKARSAGREIQSDSDLCEPYAVGKGCYHFVNLLQYTASNGDVSYVKPELMAEVAEQISIAKLSELQMAGSRK